jgi:hypothetical protein
MSQTRASRNPRPPDALALLLPPFGPDRSSVSGRQLAYFDTKLTSGAIAAVNGIIRLAKTNGSGI